MARGILDPALAGAAGLLVMGASGWAQAANPTYYNNLADFQTAIPNSVVDDYTNPGYVFLQNDLAMSAVFGETDYSSTGHSNVNIITNLGADPRYCAGCNGSFLLSFQTTSLGTADGINGVGFFVDSHSMSLPYYAFVTFADGTTDDIALPFAGSFWGVSAPERIESIHVGLSMGGTTTSGSISIDDLIIGESACTVDADCPADMNPCTDAVCNMGICDIAFNTDPCDDGSPCSVMDTCDMGSCVGVPADCDDTNDCTSDSCDPVAGCLHVPVPGPCNDGDMCTEMGECAAGICVSGPAIDCNDDDVCSIDSCDPATGCVNEPAMGCCEIDADCAADQMCDVDDNACVPLPSADESTGDEGGDTGQGDTSTPGTGGDSEGGSTSGFVTGADTFGDADTSGCVCTTGNSSRPPAWWLLAAFGLLARRRRRAA